MFSPALGGPVKLEQAVIFQPGLGAKGGYSGFDNQFSSAASSCSTTSESGVAEAGAKYQIKTMCLSKKEVRMPTKKEHGFLLFCGLGARKWQCSMDCNSLTFKQAILNIYPRLRSVIGYNLWTLTSDKKTFERIPEKINTPMRMRTYLGASFTGCLVIVPVSDIVLMEERREHIRQMDIEEAKPAAHAQAPTAYQKQETHKAFAHHPAEEPAVRRSICLICGRIEKTPGTGVFHRIMEEPLPGATDRTQVIARKLTDILGFNFEQSRKKFIASNEICRKCLRTVCDLVKKEEEVKATKEDLVSSFFSTTSKFNKNQTHLGMAEDATCPEYQHPFYNKPLPLPMAFLNGPKSGYQPPAANLLQFYQPRWPGGVEAKGSSSAPSSPPDRGTNAGFRFGGSECGSSDFASSSFASVSPPTDLRAQKAASRLEARMETDSGMGTDMASRSSYGPRGQDFDTRSFASSLSLNSSVFSVKSKGQFKAFEPLVRYKEARGAPEEVEARGAPEVVEGERVAGGEPLLPPPTGDGEDGKDGDYSNTGSPRSNSTASLASIDSTNPTRPDTPEDEAKAKSEEEAAEEEAELRKPWKKRKRAIETESEILQAAESCKQLKVEEMVEAADGKGEDSTSSSTTSESNPQSQLDFSTSDN